MAEAEVDVGGEVSPMRQTSSTDDLKIEEDALDVDPVTLSRDFTALFRVGSEKKAKVMERSIEEMMARLDEYYQLIDRIHTESAAAFDRTLPELERKCDELTALFRGIDQLEAFVTVVRENVNQLEEKVTAADKELSVNPIKRVFQKVELPSFIRRKAGFGPKTVKPPPVDKKWQWPEIFHTDDYLGKPL